MHYYAVEHTGYFRGCGSSLLGYPVNSSGVKEKLKIDTFTMHEIIHHAVTMFKSKIAGIFLLKPSHAALRPHMPRIAVNLTNTNNSTIPIGLIHHITRITLTFAVLADRVFHTSHIITRI